MIKIPRYLSEFEEQDTPPDINGASRRKAGIIVGVLCISMLLIVALVVLACSKFFRKSAQSDESVRWESLQSAAPTKSFRKWCKLDDHLAPAEKGDVENPPICVICLEVLLDKDNVRVLRCRHVYHTQCFDRWFVGHSVCPLCHSEILETKQAK